MTRLYEIERITFLSHFILFYNYIYLYLFWFANKEYKIDANIAGRSFE